MACLDSNHVHSDSVSSRSSVRQLHRVVMAPKKSKTAAMKKAPAPSMKCMKKQKTFVLRNLKSQRSMKSMKAMKSMKIHRKIPRDKRSTTDQLDDYEMTVDEWKRFAAIPPYNRPGHCLYRKPAACSSSHKGSTHEHDDDDAHGPNGDDDDDDDDDHDKSDAENSDATGGPRSTAAESGKAKMMAWARAKEEGRKCEKPTSASQWVVDELKRIDASRGTSCHLDAYQKLSRKEKGERQLQLCLHRDNYMMNMKAVEQDYRKQTDSRQARTGWKTLYQIADLESFPSAWSDEKRIAAARKLAVDKGCTGRDGKSKRLEDAGLEEFHYKFNEETLSDHARIKTVGTTKWNDVDQAGIKDMSRAIKDDMDDEWEKHGEKFGQPAGGVGAAPMSGADGKKKRKTKEEKDADKAKARHSHFI